MLITRIREHQQNSSQTNVILHITCCDAYIENSQNFVDKNIENFTGPQKAKFQNFKDKIIKSGFRYKNDREKAEAFLIRVNKPSLNDQWDHKAYYCIKNATCNLFFFSVIILKNFCKF